MFAKTIIDSDAFLDMPVTARLLYYDLSMRADDDGFVNSPKKIMRMIGASQDDLSILAMRKFIIPFESGVVVIKHWFIHNYIRKDTYTKTKYTVEKATLALDENKSYTTSPQPDNLLPSTDSGRAVDEPWTQVRIGKDNNKIISKDIICQKDPSDLSDIEQIILAWNGLEGVGIQGIMRMANDSSRYKMLKARLRTYGKEDVLTAIENVRHSSFLQGQNKKSWTITFDWFVKPENFSKVLNGNYLDKEQRFQKRQGDDEWQK